MTKFSRTWAALTIGAFAAATTGCSSSTDASTGASGASDKAAYCAPLTAAFKLNPAPGQTLPELGKAFGEALDSAGRSAISAGSEDVSAYLFFLAKMSDPAQTRGTGDVQALADALAKVKPIVQKDCGFAIS